MIKATIIILEYVVHVNQLAKVVPTPITVPLALSIPSSTMEYAKLSVLMEIMAKLEVEHASHVQHLVVLALDKPATVLLVQGVKSSTTDSA